MFKSQTRVSSILANTNYAWGDEGRYRAQNRTLCAQVGTRLSDSLKTRLKA